MAKALVKCLYCGQTFDRNDPKIPFVKVKNRYAHKCCADNHSEIEQREEKDQKAFYDYCKKIFGSKFDFVRTKKLAEGYIKKNNYSWSGMLKTMIYFYEVKKNDPSKANGACGIIPYAYQQAHDYYFSIWAAQQINSNKKIEEYIPEVIEIRIPPPEPKPRKRRLFSFLDDSEEK